MLVPPVRYVLRASDQLCTEASERVRRIVVEATNLVHASLKLTRGARMTERPWSATGGDDGDSHLF
jgi:hypothetical protein